MKRSETLLAIKWHPCYNTKNLKIQKLIQFWPLWNQIQGRCRSKYFEIQMSCPFISWWILVLLFNQSAVWKQTQKVCAQQGDWALAVSLRVFLCVRLPHALFHTHTTHCHLQRGNCQQKSWKDQSKWII